MPMCLFEQARFRSSPWPLAAANTAQAGFTLLEIVVVMVLLGMITSLTLPAMQRWHDSLLAQSEASAVVEALQAAAFSAGASKRTLQLDAASFSPGDAIALRPTPLGQTRAQVSLPAGWSISRISPAVFRADGLCEPGLVALKTSHEARLLVSINGPICRISWAPDPSAPATSGTGRQR